MKKKLSFKTRILNSFRKVFTWQPLEKVLLSVVRRTEYLGFWSRFLPNPLLYKFNSIRNVNRQGINYSLDMSCLMQWYVYWDFKAQDRDRLYSFVKKGDVIFDVGTNIGETLLNFAKLTGESGYVYGFEPDDENYQNAQKNISMNHFSNVHVFKNAASDKKETLKLYVVEPHNRGMNRILKSGEEEKEYEFTTIEATTLDNIIAENKIERLDLVKIDIEGHEMHALKGAVEMIKKFKPVLFVEIAYLRLIKNNTSPNEVMKFLEDMGYDIYHAQTDERITSKYDFSYLGDSGFDVFALPAGSKVPAGLKTK